MDKRIVNYLLALLSAGNCYCQTPAPHAIIIDEIFADPVPAVGLPPAEFIELKNNSPVAIQLYHWKLGKGNHSTIIKDSLLLDPGGYVILCARADTAEYAVYGSTIGISGFPALNNTGDTLSIITPEGVTIDAVAYDESWYRDEVKKLGGWSLEMMDTRLPCEGADNWKASIDNKGGTPGQKNSTDQVISDILSPVLVRSYTLDSLTIVAVFDKPLDSSIASNPSHYFISDGIGNPVTAIARPPLFNEIGLQLSSAILKRKVYQLTATNILDCSGDAIAAHNSVKVGLPVQPPDTLAIAINEVLFNPIAGGYDYIELYNRGNSVIDLEYLYIATRSPVNDLASITRLSAVPLLFFPGDYLVLTENTRWLNQNYIVKDPGAVVELSSLPSLPDDQGSVVLLANNGQIIDELHYDHRWQFALLNNEQGVALERIDYNNPTQSRDNWTSAAATAGYGTPGYLNSEAVFNQQVGGEIEISPSVFSPDGDGHEDFCEINFKESVPNQTANITVFDISGRPVRYLARNATLAAAGYFRWDGLDDNQQILSAGIYIILVELFDLRGSHRHFKKPVVLAKSFHQ